MSKTFQKYYTSQLLASERSERDTYRGNTIENRGCLFSERAKPAKLNISREISDIMYVYVRQKISPALLIT